MKVPKRIAQKETEGIVNRDNSTDILNKRKHWCKSGKDYQHYDKCGWNWEPIIDRKWGKNKAALNIQESREGACFVHVVN